MELVSANGSPHFQKPAAISQPLDALAEVRAALVEWFRENGNMDYGWRQTRDPYAILVSEVMLQQTQIATVLERGYFTNWMETFPNVEALAAASESAVLKAWEGLGYYRRARNLQKAAQAVVELGTFPETLEGIRALPGVGDYTAGALASCAFDLPVPVVDTNVARVLSRMFDSADPIDSTKGKRQLWSWAEQLVDPDAAREFNSGIMELGQKVCRPTAPKCGQCPVASWCLTDSPDQLPVKKARAETEEVEERVFFLRQGSCVFLSQEEAGGRREGLWRLPLLDSGSGDGRDELLRTKYGITKYRVTMLIYAGQEGDEELRGEWIELTKVEELAMASPYRKALNRLLEMESELGFSLH